MARSLGRRHDYHQSQDKTGNAYPEPVHSSLRARRPGNRHSCQQSPRAGASGIAR